MRVGISLCALLAMQRAAWPVTVMADHENLAIAPQVQSQHITATATIESLPERFAQLSPTFNELPASDDVLQKEPLREMLKVLDEPPASTVTPRPTKGP